MSEARASELQRDYLLPGRWQTPITFNFLMPDYMGFQRLLDMYMSVHVRAEGFCWRLGGTSTEQFSVPRDMCVQSVAMATYSN